MRADEPFTDVDTNKIFMPKYINQMRVDMLMRGARIFINADYRYHKGNKTKEEFDDSCVRIAFALEARANKIKEGM